MVRLLRALPVVVALMSLTSTACASGGFYTYQPGVRGVDDRAYARGYDQGLRQGEADARRNRRFDYARHGEYRNADGGYRGYGDRNAYRSLFRQGFVAGYNDGFRRYGRQGYGYPPPTYRNVPPAAYPGNRRFSPAAENGHRDGYQQGREDAGDRDRYDPIRASRYRSGDRGYERRYGSLEDYKREYRAAFQQGYEQGYREYRR